MTIFSIMVLVDPIPSTTMPTLANVENTYDPKSSLSTTPYPIHLVVTRALPNTNNTHDPNSSSSIPQGTTLPVHNQTNHSTSLTHSLTPNI